MKAERLIVGVEGPELTSREADLFREIEPAGYILFTRNLESPRQIRELTDTLASFSLDRPFISIDQEGGRVWRTREFSSAHPMPPPSPQRPPPARLLNLARSPGSFSNSLESI